MNGKYDDLFFNYKPEDPLDKIVYDLTNCIKMQNDYDAAIKIILANNLKLENIVSRTIRLTTKQIVELAMRLISLKK